MFRNYLRIAWRNLAKNKLYSFINIGGLSVGISVCMLIMVYVAHEWSFDRFHKNADRIFSLTMHVSLNGSEVSMNRMSFASGPILKEADPGIESYLRIEDIGDNRVIENTASTGKKFTERNMLLADSNFFDFFSFHLMQGDPKSVLGKPFKMVISQRAARKYFGDTNPVGRLLKYDGQYTFEITGIAANPPSNSSIDYDFIGSMSSVALMQGEGPGSTAGKVEGGKFEGGDFETFLLLKNTVKAGATEKVIRQIAGRPEGKSGKLAYTLTPLAHRHSDNDDSGNAKYRKIFSWVAALILFLALINYMSLATARSAIRAKEVGVRKVLGAGRGKIVKQFYAESGLYSLIAFVLAVLLFVILRPAFYTLLELKMDDGFLFSAYTWGIFASLCILTIFISGSYPSLVLSSFKPVKVLYGQLSRQKGGASVRKFFTILQFTISVGLIISSVIISRQLDFLLHMDTGVDREHVVMIPYQKSISGHYLAFKRNVENVNGVIGVSAASAPMYGGMENMTVAHSKEVKENILISEMLVDQTFLKMLGMRWKFPPADEQIPGQRGQVILNEEIVSKLHLSSDPVGQKVVIGGDSVTVCAVLKNFNLSSLRHKIEPLCLFVKNDNDSSWYADNGDCLFVKISPHTNIPGLLGSIRNIYDRLDKTTPFEYRFMDDAFDAQYRAENRLSKIFDVFTMITIFIACLGLFGLAAFSASQRTKEIGIRKVLGADTISIIGIISGNFIKPVLLSILLAIPLAWFFMTRWLQDFAYRTHMSAWIFVLGALTTMLIALATVSFHAIKAAVANPVKSLRSE